MVVGGCSVFRSVYGKLVAEKLEDLEGYTSEGVDDSLEGEFDKKMSVDERCRLTER